MMVAFAVGIGLGVDLIRRSVNGEAVVRFVVDRFRVPEPDLAITGVPPVTLATRRLTLAALMAAIPLTAFVFTRFAGAALPMTPTLLFAFVGAVVGFSLPAVQVRQQAREARRDFRTSLSAYLDLVSTMLAGGAGIETALVAAVRVGDGIAFGFIGDALDKAHIQRRSAWDLMAAEGERIGVDELPELAATVKLGGEQGARMTASLIAKAGSLRAKQMAEIEARANSATERMGLPMVMLFLGFLVLLGYPAVRMIGAGFAT